MAFENLVAIDFASNIPRDATATEDSAAPTITAVAYAPVSSSGAGDVETIAVDDATSLTDALAKVETFVTNEYTNEGKPWCFVTDGEWPLKVCLPTCAQAAGRGLDGNWSTCFDVCTEMARSQKDEHSRPDLRTCMDVYQCAGEPEPGAGVVECVANVASALMRDDHTFEKPMQLGAAAVEDTAPQQPQQDLGTAQRGAPDASPCLRLRGIPFRADEDAVRSFFEGYAVTEVVIVHNEAGRPAGVAMVRFASEADAVRAQEERDRQHLGERYVELRFATPEEMDAAARDAAGTNVDESMCLRLRGMPYSAGTRDIEEFFRDNQVAVDASSVVVEIGRDGRPSGTAFARAASEEDVQRALGLGRVYMGSRYIELYRASDRELDAAGRQQAHPAFGGHAAHGAAGTDHVVKLRGLPFTATEVDIATFFDGIGIAQQGVHLVYDRTNRPSGQAYVEFLTAEDVDRALMKNRQEMGTRYVEVFRSSSREMSMQGREGGGGGYGGGRDRYDDRRGGGGYGYGYGYGGGGGYDSSRHHPYGGDDRRGGGRGGGYGGRDRFDDRRGNYGPPRGRY